MDPGFKLSFCSHQSTPHLFTPQSIQPDQSADALKTLNSLKVEIMSPVILIAQVSISYVNVGTPLFHTNPSHSNSPCRLYISSPLHKKIQSLTSHHFCIILHRSVSTKKNAEIVNELAHSIKSLVLVNN